MSPERSKKAIKPFLLRAPAALIAELERAAQLSGDSVNRLVIRKLQAQAAEPKLERPAIALESKLLCYTESIKEHVGEDLIGLVAYGSWVRDDIRESSDIDLLVVLDSASNLDRDAYDKIPRGKLVGREISPLIVKLPPAPEECTGLWFEVAVDGIVLFDRDLKLSRLLRKIRAQILDGSIRRRSAYGVPYWERGNEP